MTNAQLLRRAINWMANEVGVAPSDFRRAQNTGQRPLRMYRGCVAVVMQSYGISNTRMVRDFAGCDTWGLGCAMKRVQEAVQESRQPYADLVEGLTQYMKKEVERFESKPYFREVRDPSTYVVTRLAGLRG